ncbi:serine hydrolase domain-containing protein [Thalassomonas haliotis]|uniref:Beta-lactamase family protein n=1 Tax=Thalassomonas haliotis TaxID=485448 RepID=A0ABY7V9F2_9GAMM|nr:serine hydrolase domain-containing protein [Thalassomonas haliotis]WDE09518.1 beta-lactamase family protein [Thalassomonas haliotis]
MNKTRVNYIACIITLFFISLSLNAEMLTLKKEIDDYLISEDYSGVFIAVRDGKILHEGAYGYANVEKKRQFKTSDQFRIGSLTKDFTVLLVIKLIDDGRIKSLSDPVTKYLPHLNIDGRITIEHLIKHRSGIPELLALVDIKKHYSVDELLDLIKAQDLAFHPGVAEAYSNSNYILLGAIIEKATGRTYWENVQTYIFSPLGMVNTSVNFLNLSTSNTQENSHSIGYVYSGDTLKRASHMEMAIPYAAGAYSSNLPDLKRWIDSLLNDSLISQRQRNVIFEKSFGFDWEEWQVGGMNVYSHAGGIFGFSAFIAVMPGQKNSYVVFLSNTQDQYLNLKRYSKSIFLKSV